MNKLILTTAFVLGFSLPAYAAQYSNTGEDRYAIPEFEQEKEAVEVVEKPTREQEAQQTAPIVLNGDEAEYDSASGDFYLSGNVTITQGLEKIITTYAYGNVKTGDVWLDKGGTIVEPGSTMRGKWAHYNFNSKTGKIIELTGEGKKEWYDAPSANIYSDRMVMEEGGTMSRCPAKEHPPCLSVKAETFEFYPQEKLVAHNVKVYIRGKHVYSRKLWVNNLNEHNTRIMPRIGYAGDDDGFFVKLDVDYQISEKTKANAELVEYEKAGYKPLYTLEHDERNFKVTLFDGWEEEDDTWYKKEANFRFDYKNHHIIDGLPLSYSAYFEYGKWTNDDTGMDSRRREYALYLNHDPIYLFNSKNTVLNLTVGKKWAHESYSDENLSTDMYYATLAQRLGRKFRTWVGYYREDQTSDLFEIGQPDMAKELRNGLSYTPDDKNTFTIINRYDVGKGHQYETNYTWLHRFCCWALELEYQKENYSDDSHLKLYYYFYNI